MHCDAAFILSSLVVLPSVLLGQGANHLYTFNGDSPGDRLTTCSDVGDVNKDGYADVIVGAWMDDNNGTNSGSARVISGKEGKVLYTFDGNSAGDWFGRRVSGAGDVNRDGYPDFIVGAHRDNNNQRTNSGSAWVFSGKDGGVLHTFNGDLIRDELGHSVGGVGDIDQDGYADLIVGATQPGKWSSGTYVGPGYARVFSGKDGKVLHTFKGGSGGDQFGWSVSGAGDVNRDGYADLIVGARHDDNKGTDSGSALVFSGEWIDARAKNRTPKTNQILHAFDGISAGDEFGRSVSGVGDIDGDGWADLIVGADQPSSGSGYAFVFSGKSGKVLQRFNGDSAGDRFGHSVSGAGDVNRDGYPDLIVGAIFDNNNGTKSGSALVFSGEWIAATVKSRIPKTMQILYTFDGNSAGDAFGNKVSGAGDMNGDGHADLLVGAIYDDNNGTNSGSVRVLSGKKLTLWSDKHQLSLNQGGTQRLTLDAGSKHARRLYWIYGSATGTAPGVTLNGVTVPLNPDLYTDITITFPNLVFQNTVVFQSFRGTLDNNGRASAAFNLPSGMPPIPITLYHAYLVTGPQGAWLMGSNAVPITLK